LVLYRFTIGRLFVDNLSIWSDQEPYSTYTLACGIAWFGVLDEIVLRNMVVENNPCTSSDV
jgi:hypothetical protein